MQEGKNSAKFLMPTLPGEAPLDKLIFSLASVPEVASFMRSMLNSK